MNKLRVLLLGGLLLACSRTPSSQVDDAGPGVVDAGGSSAATPDGSCLMNAYPNAEKSCVCQQDTPTPCLTACTNLTTDDDNCGACGHACPPTSACAAGACSPMPTTAVPAAPGCGSLSLVAANGMLTWADQGHGLILRGSTLDPTITPTTIASGEHAPVGVLVRGAAVFWLDSVDLPPAGPPFAGMPPGSSTSTIRRAAEGVVTDVITITAAKTDPSDPGAIHGFTVSEDGGTVYFSTGQKIQRVPTSGGTPTDAVVMDTFGDPWAIALQGDLVAFTLGAITAVDIAQVGDVVAHCWHDDPMTGLPLDINCNRVAHQGELNLGGLALDAAKVFFVSASDLKAHTLSLEPGKDWMEISQAVGSIQTIVASGGKVYFGDFDVDTPTSGHIERADEVQNAPAIPLARNLARPDSIAVDGKKVFWSNADCEIQTTSTGD